MENVLADKAAEERAVAREKVAVEARRGRAPHDSFGSSDLAWCFSGHEDELEELEQVARERRAREVAAPEASRRRMALKRETLKVLGEWERERYQQAEAEARKRLSLGEDA